MQTDVSKRNASITELKTSPTFLQNVCATVVGQRLYFQNSVVKVGQKVIYHFNLN